MANNKSGVHKVVKAAGNQPITLIPIEQSSLVGDPLRYAFEKPKFGRLDLDNDADGFSLLGGAVFIDPSGEPIQPPTGTVGAVFLDAYGKVVRPPKGPSGPKFFGFSGGGPEAADARLARTLTDIITARYGVDASQLSIYVNNGAVTLKGTVKTEAERKYIEAIVRSVGVESVTNSLELRPTSAPSTDVGSL